MWSEYIDQNTGAEEADLVVEADPARRLRESIDAGAAPARAESLPRAVSRAACAPRVDGAALAQRYHETVVLSSPPLALQRVLSPLLARFTSAIPSPRRLGRR